MRLKALPQKCNSCAQPSAHCRAGIRNSSFLKSVKGLRVWISCSGLDAWRDDRPSVYYWGGDGCCFAGGGCCSCIIGPCPGPIICFIMVICLFMLSITDCHMVMLSCSWSLVC